MINTVCFFELPVDEFEPLQDFYNKLFNWTFEKVPGGFRYYKIHMGQDSPKGGMTARQDPTHTPVNYVKVEAIEESLKKAERLGAKESTQEACARCRLVCGTTGPSREPFGFVGRKPGRGGRGFRFVQSTFY